jgi:CheY-like chemotaxis protein
MPVLLVIDDDDAIRSLIASYFTANDYTVIEAADGRSALQKFAKADVDVVITDLIMPDMEGIETIRELHKLKPCIKIIALSGGGSMSPSGYLNIASKMGAQYSFSKPVSLEVLKNAVEKLLNEEPDSEPGLPHTPED